MIHRTALVDPTAQLGHDATVGPYAIIGPHVTVGERCHVAAHAVLERNVRLGWDVKIGYGTIIGNAPQDLKYKGEDTWVEVGNATVIREYCTINRGTVSTGKTSIGRRCFLMSYVHVAHDCVIGDHVIIINYAGLTGHVTVEDRATVGGLTGVHPFVHIGTYAYVGGCSKVIQDVPPFVMVDGVPATARAVNLIGMRRAGIDAGGRRQVKAAFRILYRSGQAPGAAAAQIKTELGDHPLVARLVEFIEASRRGIVGGATGGVDEEPGEGEE